MNQSAIWFFKPGTEERVEVLHFDDGKYGIACQHCGKGFQIGEAHGPSVGPDGALTTAHSMVCPLCKVWHVRMSGGVAQ